MIAKLSFIEWISPPRDMLMHLICNVVLVKLFVRMICHNRTQGKIDLRNESGRPMKVKVVGEVSEK